MATKQEKSQTYEVQGQKYVLPPPSLTKPLSSTAESGGLLDTWPAHASGRTVPDAQVFVTKDARLVVIDDESAGRASLVPKPKFLEQLEGYLKRELKSHNVDTVEANNIRLQIHREVFEYLIEAFKTYKPLLSGIKREYEMMVAHLREEIRRLEPMKEMLWTLSQECDMKIMAIRAEEKDEMRQLRDLNQGLREKIDQMRSQQHDLQQQVDTLKDELVEVQQRYRDEADSRKLLVADMNELRSQQEDLSIFKKSADSDESAEDPVQLRIALNQAKKSQAELIDRITRMEADYSDVVPRRQHEQLVEQFAAASAENESYKTDSARLVDEHRALQDLYDQVLKQRDEYYTECERLKANGTPRPDWDRCSDYITGGADRWQELSQGKRTDELVDIILQEMSGLTSGEAQQLEPMGEGEEVPLFLRHNEPVNNRRMTKRDTRIHIREIWDERKREKDEQAVAYERGTSKPLTPIGDFIDQLFRKLYGIEQIRIEWAYSFYDALQRYAPSDDRCALFLQVLQGQTDEDVYWEDMRTMGRLLDAFKVTDPSGSCLIERQAMADVLQQFFPSREAETCQQLVEIAAQEMDSTASVNVEYDKLFMTDDEGEFGAFLKEIRKLLLEDKDKYIEELRKELVDIASPPAAAQQQHEQQQPDGQAEEEPAASELAAATGSPRSDKVTPDDCLRAFSIVDPSVEQSKLDSWLRWVYSVAMEEDYKAAEPISIDSVCERLRAGTVRRMGKRI